VGPPASSRICHFCLRTVCQSEEDALATSSTGRNTASNRVGSMFCGAQRLGFGSMFYGALRRTRQKVTDARARSPPPQSNIPITGCTALLPATEQGRNPILLVILSLPMPVSATRKGTAWQGFAMTRGRQLNPFCQFVFPPTVHGVCVSAPALWHGRCSADSAWRSAQRRQCCGGAQTDRQTDRLASHLPQAGALHELRHIHVCAINYAEHHPPALCTGRGQRTFPSKPAVQAFPSPTGPREDVLASEAGPLSKQVCPLPLGGGGIHRD
jgi:hypothetical protein